MGANQEVRYTMGRFAEKANYWSTTVHPARSQGEVLALLEDFGAERTMIAQGSVDGRPAWLVRFAWMGASYRFVFSPLRCVFPERVTSFGGKRRSHLEQARYQMGRVAVHCVKAVLTAAEMQPSALFGFIELPAVGQHPGGMPMTAGELGVAGLVSALPELALSGSTLLTATVGE